MSVVAGLGKAAAVAAGVPRGARPTRGRAFPKTKRASVVVAVALLAFVAFSALISSSEAPNAEHSTIRRQARPIGRGRPRRFPGRWWRLG